MALLNGQPAAPEVLQDLALSGYGHFTSMRAEEGCIRGLTHHLERLARDCRVVFGTDLDREQVRSCIRDAIAGRRGSLIVHVTVFEPAIGLAHSAAPAPPHIQVTSWLADPLPATPLRVQPQTYAREEPTVKHVGLFGPLRRRRTAVLAGFDDALFTDKAGFISEGTTWNIAFFDGERVVWPGSDILPGITMQLLKQVHERTVTSPVNLRHLPQMQAAFATSTASGVRAITAIGDHRLPADHEIFEVLRKEYQEIPAEPV
ncbi:aminotransferase class IV family protein [Actinocorallia libanotica]|uniref:Aminotransferase class IV family protein n=1 Tax=Actinocorallia libanotica TaxID=46162 RepID=A0ABP4BW43_9ACTN